MPAEIDHSGLEPADVSFTGKKSPGNGWARNLWICDLTDQTTLQNAMAGIAEGKAWENGFCLNAEEHGRLKLDDLFKRAGFEPVEFR